MKAFLMYKDRDFRLDEVLPPNTEDLTQDLELNTLFSAMAAGDAFLFEVAKPAVLASLRGPEEILYRQQILADCLEWPEIVRQIYGIAVEALERERKIWGGLFGRYPDGLLHRSVDVLKLFIGLLKRLREIANEDSSKFRSDGFTRLFHMLVAELNDDYLGIVEDHLQRLEFRSGILMSAELGKGNKGRQYVLRKPAQTGTAWRDRIQNWMERLPLTESSSYVYQIADRDEAGFRALSELKGRGMSHVAAALAQSTDHILSFFSMLRLELGFYVGCMNLRDKVARKDQHVCFPEPLPAGEPMLSARGLYDVCLSLSMQDNVVGNDVNADDKLLVLITGANGGGKSTFLRSVGLAQLMMQCGMFTPAEFFCANICRGVFTHFKREEDAGMKSGKLDEELSRMSTIVDNVNPNSIVVFNESFASTNEREGSEIARQIIQALLESGTKVLCVTHQFDLTEGFYRAKMQIALFLRAERLADGRRTFRLAEHGPLPTSHGEDLYGRIFADAVTVAPAS